jgi:hypothetical protein
LPENIPAAPWQKYANQGWAGMGDWLGTGTIAPRLREYRAFHKARAFARSLKLKSRTEWKAFCKGEMPHLGQMPPDIPSNPNRTYSDQGWVSMGDWLGTGTIAARLRKYRSFQSARTFARKLKLKNQTEWAAFCKGEMPQLGRLPEDIPVAAWQAYADKGWSSMGDWLGTGNVANFLKEYRPFQQARTFARNLKLKSGTEWSAYCKGEMSHLGHLPADIPAYPNQTYASKGWAGMGDWLGTGRTRVSKSSKRKG